MVAVPMPEDARELDHRLLRHAFVQHRDSSPWCTVHGDRHPRIDAAIRDQLERGIDMTTREPADPPAAELAARLVEIAPPGLSRVLYSESASAAAGVALTMALEHWQRLGGQHRRRTSFVTLRGGREEGEIGAGSLVADPVRRAHGPVRFRTHRVDADDADRLAEILDIHEEEVAAVIVEPLVQGPAGVRVQPPGLLRRVRELCDLHGAFLICDETVTGFGRTGTMFACEQERVAPDFLCLGRGLTGGYVPLAATLTTERVYEELLAAPEDAPAFLGGDAFTGNPLGCAAALACLEAFREERTLLRLQPKIRLLGELLEPVAEMPEVAEVRGRGFVVGIDLGRHDRSLGLGPRAAREARERGVIVNPIGDVIALAPPLTISKAELRRLVESVAAAIRAAHRRIHDGPAASVEAIPARRAPGAGAVQRAA